MCNLRIDLNLSVWMSKPKFDLLGWQLTCQNYICHMVKHSKSMISWGNISNIFLKVQLISWKSLVWKPNLLVTDEWMSVKIFTAIVREDYWTTQVRITGFGPRGGPQVLRPKVADVAKRFQFAAVGHRARLRALASFWVFPCSNMHSPTLLETLSISHIFDGLFPTPKCNDKNRTLHCTSDQFETFLYTTPHYLNLTWKSCRFDYDDLRR